MKQVSIYAGTIRACARPAIRGVMIISRTAGQPEGLVLKNLTVYKEGYFRTSESNQVFKVLISGGYAGQLHCFIIKDPAFRGSADYAHTMQLIIPEGIAIPFPALNKPWGCRLMAGRYTLHDLGSHWGVRLPLESGKKTGFFPSDASPQI